MQEQKTGTEDWEGFQVVNNCLMVRLPEEVDHHKAGIFSERADWYIVKKKVDHVIFDFQDTRFMDSSGVGVIMGRYKKISCLGGRVYIVNADRQVRRILRLSGMDRLVEVVEAHPGDGKGGESPSAENMSSIMGKPVICRDVSLKTAQKAAQK